MTENDATAPVRKPGFLGRLRSWFLTGLLVTAPVLLTVYITWAAIELIDGQVASILPGFNKLVVANIPGAGLIIGLILITVIGAVAAGFLGRWLIGLGESILNRMPVVRTIYGASKQILETVISAQSDAFRDAVLVEYPRRGLWVIGFVTGGTKGEVADRMDGNMVNVFIPTTPNPTSGFLLFCPRDEVIYLDMSVEDAVKLVVSGGIVHPPEPAAGKGAKKAARKSAGKSSAKAAVKARGKKGASTGVAKTSSGRKSPAKSAAKRT
ncbi:MAG: DUF502 domain-containing protein [Pseudomonadota bacterium]|jgi:uncharacterized membrane protein|nr:DUF502 domain-containing protein [Pseudomonadota bacterium]